MSLQKHFTDSPLGSRAVWLAAALGLSLFQLHCGSDEPPPPPPPPMTVMLYDTADPCGTNVPSPSDFFIDADGQTETTGCPLPTDPIKAAIELAQRYDGAAVDSEIRIPIEGSLDPTTLNSTVAFALMGTSSAAGALPTVVLLEQTGSSTAADGWAVVDATVTYDGTSIRVRPRADLAFNRFHAALVTRVPKDSEQPQNPLGQSAAVKALLGSTTISEGAFEGLTADAAGRLDRMRVNLEPVLAVLAGASPPIPTDQIASLHGFTTEKGPAHLTAAVDDYFEAIAAGRYRYEQENRVVPFSEVYPGLPPTAWEGVAEFRTGTIKAPRLLDDNGHLRANWTEQVETIDIPFSISVPARAARFGVTLFVPGWGRGKIDGRGLAPQLGMAATSAVLTIDLRCHGDRSVDSSGICGENRNAQEVADLADNDPNNGNPEFAGGDGIPDDSGIGFFPGEPRALRDTQIAAIIEILHVLHALREGDMFEDPIAVNIGQIHLVAQGHSAPAAMGALANIRFPTNSITFQAPSGGAGYPELILDGADELEESFLASAPDGITASNARDYLTQLEETILSPLDPTAWGPELRERLKLVPGSRVRILLNHGRVAQYVSADARQNLIDALSLRSEKVSEHNGACDDFFIFTCNLGDNPAWLTEAAGQIASFVSSGGVTFNAPAP